MRIFTHVYCIAINRLTHSYLTKYTANILSSHFSLVIFRSRLFSLTYTLSPSHFLPLKCSLSLICSLPSLLSPLPECCVIYFFFSTHCYWFLLMLVLSGVVTDFFCLSVMEFCLRDLCWARKTWKRKIESENTKRKL